MCQILLNSLHNNTPTPSSATHTLWTPLCVYSYKKQNKSYSIYSSDYNLHDIFSCKMKKLHISHQVSTHRTWSGLWQCTVRQASVCSVREKGNNQERPVQRLFLHDRGIYIIMKKERKKRPPIQCLPSQSALTWCHMITTCYCHLWTFIPSAFDWTCQKWKEEKKKGGGGGGGRSTSIIWIQKSSFKTIPSTLHIYPSPW